MKEYYVYILASNSKTIYIWITNNLQRRIYEHKEWLIDWFSKKYSCTKLVYYESFSNVNDAIESEKKLKNWKREWKVKLIEKENPFWEELYNLDDSESSSEWQWAWKNE